MASTDSTHSTDRTRSSKAQFAGELLVAVLAGIALAGAEQPTRPTNLVDRLAELDGDAMYNVAHWAYMKAPWSTGVERPSRRDNGRGTLAQVIALGPDHELYRAVENYTALTAGVRA